MTILFSTAFWMLVAGCVALAVGSWAARADLARSRGLEKIVALTYVCYGMPLAMFGSAHFTSPRNLLNLVPRYMPSRMFWIYLVGTALIAAGLSIASRMCVQCSGTLVGILMWTFVAMIFLPAAIKTGNRLSWTVSLRELSFGGAGWVLAGVHGGGRRMVAIGRTLIGITAIFFGVQHFLHPLSLAGVPLQRQMPGWVPAPQLIDYVTGALLIVAGVCFLLGWMSGWAAKYLGAWLLLLVVVIYLPVMVNLMGQASTRVEGINYFADTLLFAGTVLSVAVAKSSSR